LALYHATIRYLSRSNRNTVKAVAYRTGTDLYDAKTGQWFYHSDKNVAHVEILLPKDAPLWAKELQKEISENRQKGVQKFSDLVEQAEKRKDSQIYNCLQALSAGWAAPKSSRASPASPADPCPSETNSARDPGKTLAIPPGCSGNAPEERR
jgi:MobA/MobL family